MKNKELRFEINIKKTFQYVTKNESKNRTGKKNSIHNSNKKHKITEIAIT